MNDGWIALMIAIFRNVDTETAFSILRRSERLEDSGKARRVWSEEEIAEIMRLKEQGACWKDIGLMLNTSKANAQRIYQYHKKKRRVK